MGGRAGYDRVVQDTTVLLRADGHCDEIHFIEKDFPSAPYAVRCRPSSLSSLLAENDALDTVRRTVFIAAVPARFTRWEKPRRSPSFPFPLPSPV